MMTEVSRFPSATSRMTAATRGFRVPWPRLPQSTPETDIGEIIFERSAQIGEGRFGAATGGVTPCGSLLRAGRIQPGDRAGFQTEVEMVGDRIGGAGLRLGTADLLLGFSESGFGFPESP
jgi:hypothetical protein